LIVLIPLAGLLFGAFRLGIEPFLDTILSPRVLSALRVSFGASAIAALINLPFGLIVAWVLVRYSFPGKRIVDALVDLPFALPTAVAGISLAAVFAGNGWVGQFLEPLGLKIA